MNTGADAVESDDRQYFSRIAHLYDQHRSPGGPHDDVLSELARRGNAERVLEIGSGTGNSTTAFIESHPCVPIGMDLSSEMLSQAKSKGLDALWVNGNGMQIPLADSSVDFIFSVLAFHHIESPEECLRECYRVLSQGTCAVVTAPHEFIRSHIMNRYFPSFSTVDLARFPSEDRLRGWMQEAGFVDTDLTYCAKAPEPIGEAYIQKIESRFISTYALLSDEEFEAGLARLREDIAETGHLKELTVWQSVVVSGRKA